MSVQRAEYKIDRTEYETAARRLIREGKALVSGNHDIQVGVTGRIIKGGCLAEITVGQNHERFYVCVSQLVARRI